MIKVEGHPNLRRDPNTGAITNVNSNAFNSYMIRKANFESDKHDLEKVKTDLDMLKGEITDIKNLLVQLTQK